MGTVHRFPSERVKGALYPVERETAAEILILPAIRIERHEEFVAEPAPSVTTPPEGRSGSKTRRRARRG